MLAIAVDDEVEHVVPLRQRKRLRAGSRSLHTIGANQASFAIDELNLVANGLRNGVSRFKV